MTAAIGLAQLVLLAGLAIAALSAIAVRSVQTLILRSVGRLGPRTRADVLLAILALPLAAGVTAPALCFVPSAGALVAPQLDHCEHHEDHHPHLCLAHPPASAGSLLGWLIAAAGAGVVGIGAAKIARRARSEDRLIASLEAMAARSGDVLTIATDEPLCFTAGLVAPRILVSTGLARGLDVVCLEAALAHERAHVRRKDPLRKLIAHVLGALHLPGARRGLLRALDLACEQACDEDAARAIDDRLEVARALVVIARRVERAFATPRVLGSDAAVTQVEARVTALLGDPIPEAAPSRAWAFAGVLAIPLAFLLHHSIESLLALLVS